MKSLVFSGSGTEAAQHEVPYFGKIKAVSSVVLVCYRALGETVFVISIPISVFCGQRYLGRMCS